MHIEQIEEIHHKKVLIELSCGTSFWVDVYPDVVVDEDWVMQYLTTQIGEITLFNDEVMGKYVFDWYENKGYNLSRMFSTPSTPELIKYIKDNDEGASNMSANHGIQSKDLIKYFIEQNI